MLALILWLTLGWRAGVGEILVEIAIALMLLGGGGGRRIRLSLRRWMTRRFPVPATRPAS